jgi:hypothetical protein
VLKLCEQGSTNCSNEVTVIFGTQTGTPTPTASPAVSPTPTPTSTATPTPTATLTPTPTPTSGITLSATGYKVQGRHTVDLSWSGATSANVDIYRDGVVIMTVPNNGFYTDHIGARGNATYTYKICENTALLTVRMKLR